MPHSKSYHTKTRIKENNKQADLVLVTIIFNFILPEPREMKIFFFFTRRRSYLYRSKPTLVTLNFSYISVIMLSFHIMWSKKKLNSDLLFVKQRLMLGTLIAKLTFGIGSWQKAPRVLSLGLNYAFLIET